MNSEAYPIRRYFISSNGTTQGPFEQSEMMSFIENGHVDKSTQIMVEGAKVWESAEKLFSIQGSSSASSRSAVITEKGFVLLPAARLGPGYANKMPGEKIEFRVPKETLQVSWGAFFWGPIWGGAHGVWWSLLALAGFWIPYLWFAVTLCLMIYGRRQAWINEAWSSVHEMEHKESQWTITGILLNACVLMYYFFVLDKIILPIAK